MNLALRMFLADVQTDLVKRNETKAKGGLEDNFGAVTCIQNGQESVKLSIKDTYIAPHISDINLGNFFSAVVRGRVWRPEEISVITSEEDLDEGYDDLINELSISSVQDGGHVLVYKPKGGQDPDIVAPNKAYKTVHRNQRIHDHSSPRLIDFHHVSVLPISPEHYPLVDYGLYELNHCHFLAH